MEKHKKVNMKYKLFIFILTILLISGVTAGITTGVFTDIIIKDKPKDYLKYQYEYTQLNCDEYVCSFSVNKFPFAWDNLKSDKKNKEKMEKLIEEYILSMIEDDKLKKDKTISKKVADAGKVRIK